MASYFYLMSSLPMLKPDSEMPISYNDFLYNCKGNISDSKYELLKNLTLDSEDGPLIKEWAKVYRKYKGELTFQRSKKLGLPLNQNYDKDDSAGKVISLAIADENPLNAEKTLLSFLFDRLDLLIGTHAYDDYALFGYALKLKLLERKTVFNTEKGKAELDKLVKSLEEQITKIN